MNLNLSFCTEIPCNTHGVAKNGHHFSDLKLKIKNNSTYITLLTPSITSLPKISRCTACIDFPPITIVHTGAFFQFPFRWIYDCHSSKSTGKESGKTHFSAVQCKPSFQILHLPYSFIRILP